MGIRLWADELILLVRVLCGYVDEGLLLSCSDKGCLEVFVPTDLVLV